MFRRFAFAAALLALTSAPLAAQPSYSRVFFFGTSELDVGNWLVDPTLSSNPNGPLAGNGYWNGRWSSGYAWSDYLSQLLLGQNSTPSLLNGDNYAYGLGWLGPLPGEIPTPGTLRANSALYFGTQVNAAIAKNGGALPSNALYVISVGSNDVDFWQRTVDQADDVANLALQHIQTLVNAGARNFLVQTLGGTTPYVMTYNQTLLAGLAAINGINVSVVDTRTFNQTIVLAPGFEASLGITQPTGNCLADPVCAAAAKAKTLVGEMYLDSPYRSFDGIHRDTKLSEALALYAVTQLVPEPGTYALVALGLIATGLVHRKRRKFGSTI